MIASGNSMIGDGIDSGDLLLIRTNAEVKRGDGVFARNHTGCTVKKYSIHRKTAQS